MSVRSLLQEARQVSDSLKSRLVELYERVRSGRMTANELAQLEAAVRKIRGDIEESGRRLEENGE